MRVLDLAARFFGGVAACGIFASPIPAVSAQQKPADPGWIAVDQDILDGKNITAVDTSKGDGLPSSFYKELDATVGLRFGMIHSDLLQTAVVETSSEITRSVDFPGDEVVRMQSGQTIFIDEPTGRVQVAREGDYFLVPAHWRGLWIFKAADGKPAREHAIVSAFDYSERKKPLDPTAFPVDQPRPTVTVLRPSDLEAKRADMTPVDFAYPASTADGSALRAWIGMVGEPSMLLLETRAALSAPRAAGCESVVRVQAGTMELVSGKAKHVFGPGTVAVLKKSFEGTVTLSGGFSAVSIVSTGEGTPPYPGKPVPAIQRCPAI